MELQERVIEHLNKHGIKKKHLASILGIYPVQFWQWLSGRYTLNETQTQKLEAFLNIKY